MAGNYSSLGNSGNAPTKSVVNAFSSGGASVAGLAASSVTNMAKETLSGALTANTLKTLLTVSTPGQSGYLVAYAKDTTSRTIRLRVTVDGAVVFDATSNAITVVGTGLAVVASGAATAVGSSEPIRWNSSLVVEVASSITETDKVAMAHVQI